MVYKYTNIFDIEKLNSQKKPLHMQRLFPICCRDLVGEQDFEDLDSCRGDRRAGAEDGRRRRRGTARRSPGGGSHRPR